MRKQVFLGGTCGNNNWRDGLISRLISRGIPPECLFNPVVEHWNEEAQRREEIAKTDASYMLFFIADPRQEGINVSFYSVIEATMALYDEPKGTVVVFDTTGMGEHNTKAMNQACKVLKTRFPDANIFANLSEAEEWLAVQLMP